MRGAQTWIQRGRKDDWLKKMYDEATKGILEHLVQARALGPEGNDVDYNP